MRIPPLVTLSLVAAIAAVPVHRAESQVRPAPVSKVTATIFEVTPYAGYLVFGDYISGPFGTSLSNAPAAVVGAQLGMRIAPSIAVIANLATGSSDIKAGIPLLAGVSVAQSSVVLYDAGLQLDLPMSTMSGASFSPFVQAGAGAMRYNITRSILTTTTTNFAGNVGIGADVSVGSGVGVRAMAKDYIGRFDFAEAISLDVPSETSHNFAFSLGLRFSF